MTEAAQRLTVEDVRKLALPLGTRVSAGEGLLLSRPVAWTTVIYPSDSVAAKTLQNDELILVAPRDNSSPRQTSDVDVVRWASENKASAVVLSESPSPNAIAEANAYGIPVMSLPNGSRIRMVEKAVVSLLVDHKG